MTSDKTVESVNASNGSFLFEIAEMFRMKAKIEGEKFDWAIKDAERFESIAKTIIALDDFLLAAEIACHSFADPLDRKAFALSIDEFKAAGERKP